MATISQIRRNLQTISRNISKAQQRAVATTRRSMATSIKKSIVELIPALKTGLNKRINTKISMKIDSNGTVSAVISLLSNQPNARRFITSRKGSWAQTKARRPKQKQISSPNGGLWVTKPGKSGTVFIKGAFSKQIGDNVKPLVWKRDGDKLVAVRGYSSLGLFLAQNKTAPRAWVEKEWQRKGLVVLRREYERQLVVLGVSSPP